MKFRIRPAARRDLPAVVGLIRQLAAFEQLPPPHRSALRRLSRDGFGRRPLFKILVAERGPEIVAYAFYFFTYSTFLARPTLYIEDIFVRPDARRRGIGERFVRALAAIARRSRCGRMEWMVLDWNSGARRFYRRLGARSLPRWILYRIDLRAAAGWKSRFPDRARTRSGPLQSASTGSLRAPRAGGGSRRAPS